MDYKEKYEQALERARMINNGEDVDVEAGTTTCEYIFPELKESEDERIRKELIGFLQLPNPQFVGERKQEKWIAWLEKQGEEKEYTFKSIPRLLEMIEPSDRAKAYCQKLIDTFAKKGYNTDAKIVEDVLKGWNGEGVPMVVMDEQKPINDTDEEIIKAVKDTSILDMVEPKFHEGDWVVQEDIGVYKVIEVCESWYEVVDNEDKHYSIGFDKEYMCHIWTIEDAKDGDVLACGDKVTDYPFIFHNLTEKLNPRSYCGVNTLCDFQENDENGGSWCDSEEVRPATKEQRDFLFSKMHEAGYEWDNEMKELEKVEPADEIGRKFKVGDIVQYITDSTDRRKIVGVDTLCDMYTTDSSPIMFEVEDEWKVVVNAEDIEQNPAPEPNFNVGDLVVDNHGKVNQVTSVTDDSYAFTLYDGTYVCGCWKDYYHLWTIQDAKDGDVLASGDVIFIFNKIHGVWVNCLCTLHKDGSFIDEDYDLMHIKYSKEVYPATKEQRDLLFAKMKEAGYEWDADKKELKKIDNRFDYENANIQQKDFAPKASTANRQVYNRAILKLLSDYVEKHPDIRFGQMLCNLDVNPHFDQESRETYWNLNETINKKS